MLTGTRDNYASWPVSPNTKRSNSSIFILDLVLIAIQVRLEEEYLLESHGDDYANYQGRVLRWL